MVLRKGMFQLLLRSCVSFAFVEVARFSAFRPTIRANSISRQALLSGPGAHYSSPLQRFTGRKGKISFTQLSVFGNDDEGNNFNRTAAAPTADLTRALVRLDRQWKLQQSVRPGASRWKQIFLEDDEPKTNEQPDFEVGNPASAFTTPMMAVEQPKYVYLLEPPNKSMPSSIIVFCGGAGLGQFPQVAYNELLLRLSNRMQAAIVAVPYSLGLDHFELSKTVGKRVRKALIHCEDDPTLSYPTSLPTYALGHSLGCKLLTIYLAATNQRFEGVGFVSFNNFAFSQTIGMAKEFADQLGQAAGTRTGSSEGASSRQSDSTRSILNQVFKFAETAVSFIGLDFTPTSSDLKRIVNLKYDENQQLKTRMFSFDQDTLDSTAEIVEACPGIGPKVSSLKGTHLTPVFFRLGLDQLPEEVRDVSKNFVGDFQGASFGNEDELNALVEEICGWIFGREPTQKPAWLKEPALLTAGNSSGGDDDQSKE